MTILKKIKQNAKKNGYKPAYSVEYGGGGAEHNLARVRQFVRSSGRIDRKSVV